MIEELLLKLLEQTPVIIVLGLGIWDFRGKLATKDKEAAAERKAHKKALKELNEEVREATKECFVTTDKLCDAIEKLKRK